MLLLRPLVPLMLALALACEAGSPGASTDATREDRTTGTTAALTSTTGESPTTTTGLSDSTTGLTDIPTTTTALTDSTTDLDTGAPLPAPRGYWLPLACGATATVGQGNDSAFSHTGDAKYAFDILLAPDTPVHAMADGVVSRIYDLNHPGDPCHDGGDESCFALANLVVLAHGDATTTLYKHLNIVSVAVGAFVPRGDVVGLSGSTGWSTTPHLHVMRMQPCDDLQCPSIPLRFTDVPGGVPVTGQPVTSLNCPDR